MLLVAFTTVCFFLVKQPYAFLNYRARFFNLLIFEKGRTVSSDLPAEVRKL